MSRFHRAVGVAILVTVLLGAAVIWWAVRQLEPEHHHPASERIVWGVWKVFYDTQAPPLGVLVTAIGVALLVGSGVAGVERTIASRARRSVDRDHQPLAPRVVMADTRGVFHGPVTVTVLIPAHNEESRLAATLSSLLGQSPPPQRVVVVADNCTDRTPDIARQYGVEVFETVGNSDKKAGALNQALATVLPHQGENDLVMVMDADTTLEPGFLRAAVHRFTEDRALMALGALFHGERGAGLLGDFQRNEFTRYARDIRRRRGRVFVLTGTASVFRPRALRTIAAERGRVLPGIAGDYYDTVVLTEDNELTLALKTLGALMISPPECRVVTEVMPSWRALWTQRLRWQRGALENLGDYGLRPQTLRYWAQQLGIGYGVVALPSYLALMVVMTVAVDHFVWFTFWIGVGLFFTVERIVTGWTGGWRARLLAATLFPELIYAIFLDLVYLKGVLDIALDRDAAWKHVEPAAGVAR